MISAALTACAGLTGKVRTGDKGWLAQCPPEQREEVRKLELEVSGGAAVLVEGPHVIIPEEGVELSDGPYQSLIQALCG